MNAPIRRSMPFSDGAMSYLEWQGPPGAPLLVFTHANGFNATTYKTLLQPLSDSFRIVAPDMRGHGLSTLALDKSKLPGWRVYRDDLLRLVHGLGVKPAVMAGHSLGASAALMAAAAEPGIAGALVLTEPVMTSDRLAIVARVARFFGVSERFVALVRATRRRRTRFASREDAVNGFTGRGAFKTWPRETVADYVETGLVPDGGGFRLACPPDWEAATFSVFPFRLARLGGKVRAAVTVLSASERSTAYNPALEGFMRRHGHVKRIAVPGTTHFLPMERPEIVRRELRLAAGLPG